MNTLLNSKYLINTCKTFPSSKPTTVYLCVCTAMWLRVPFMFLVPSSESLNYYRQFCSYLNYESYRRNISKHANLSCKMSTSETGESNSKSLVLRLGDYDCIGFDLDNTLCEYNISSSVQMEYNVLAEFLVKQKGYDTSLLQPLDSNAIDFLQKGLIIDFARGNILKIGENGVIIKASHGTNLLTEEEIIIAYGENKKWQVTSEFSRNLLVAWDGPLSEKMRALLDYFDMPAALAYARIIDSLGDKFGKSEDASNIWLDVKDGLINMYNRDHFVDGRGDYFKNIKSAPHKFIKKCDTQVVEWLNKIKETRVTFLITGSNCDFASLTAETCLGENWKNLFDIVICYARKPGFFVGCRPFVRLEKFKETSVIGGTDLEFGQMYSQGNWQELYKLFSRKTKKQQPRCLYFGDNLIQDIYTPSEYTKCDTVAIVEELNLDQKDMSQDYSQNQSSQKILQSIFWGSYFYDNKKQLNTIWGSVIKKNAKMCIPSLSILAQDLLNHE